MQKIRAPPVAQRSNGVFGATKRSAHSKQVPPEQLRFIEGEGSSVGDAGESSSAPSSRLLHSRTTASTITSAASEPPARPAYLHHPNTQALHKLPPLGKARAGSAPRLPNLVGTPTERSRASTAAASVNRRSTAWSSGKGAWGGGWESEIIAHRRLGGSLDSLVSARDARDPEAPVSSVGSGSEVSQADLSESGSFVLVRRRIRVAWEGPRRARPKQPQPAKPSGSQPRLYTPARRLQTSPPILPSTTASDTDA